MKKNILFYVARHLSIYFLFCILFSCDGGGSKRACPDCPKVTDITPKSGWPGTILTITGENFETFRNALHTPTEEAKILIGGAEALITGEVKSDTLKAQVPEGSSGGPILVQVKKLDLDGNPVELNSDDPWVLEHGGTIPEFSIKEMSISSINPNFGKSGDIITISGENLHESADIQFNNARASLVVQKEDGSLEVEVPVGAGSGVIEVSIGGQVLRTENFEYLFTATKVEDFFIGGNVNRQDGSLSNARYFTANDILFDENDDIFFSDGFSGAGFLRRIRGTQVSTMVGNGTSREVSGPALNVGLNHPKGITKDRFGNIYITSLGTGSIKKLSNQNYLTTFWANISNPVDIISTEDECLYALSGSEGKIYKDCPGYSNPKTLNIPSGALKYPRAMARNEDGVIYISSEHQISKWEDGFWKTFVGSDAQKGVKDGKGRNARFNWPTGLDIHKNGNLFVADWHNNRIRQITPSGQVTTLAGSNSGTQNWDISQGGDAVSRSSFTWPATIAISNDGTYLLVSEGLHQRIRKITIE